MHDMQTAFPSLKGIGQPIDGRTYTQDDVLFIDISGTKTGRILVKGEKHKPFGADLSKTQYFYPFFPHFSCLFGIVSWRAEFSSLKS